MQTLTEAEVAEMLRCTKAALRKWRREGRGPRFIRVGVPRRTSQLVLTWLLITLVTWMVIF